MFYAIVEFILSIFLNSHLAFCLCNLIIGILSVTFSKSYSSPSHHQKVDLSKVVSRRMLDDQKKEGEVLSIKAETSSSPEKRAISLGEGVPSSCNTVEDAKRGDEEDEFRRRVEEFIGKINGAWKAEMLENFSPHVRTEKLHGAVERAIAM